MLTINEEYFDKHYYFLLREKKDGGHLWFAAEPTLSEARKKDSYIKLPKNAIEKVKKHLEKLIKSKNKKSTKEVKSEIEELVDLDGSLKTSAIPILDPRLHPRKTMDQTIQATTQPGNYLARTYAGGRTFYSETEMKEEDLSGAFGYEETKDLPPKQTIKKLKSMGVDNPVERAIEFGKDPKISQEKKKKGSQMRIRLQEKEILDKIARERMAKMVEDILVGKEKSKSSKDVHKSKKDNLEISKSMTKDFLDLLKQIEDKQSKIIKSSK
jgi:hypothetical protein